MRVLVLARNYPNNVTQFLGLWVERLVQHSKTFCRPVVVAPVPYCPPVAGLPESFSRFRKVERYRVSGGVEVYHPRFVTGPGYSLYNFEAHLYAAGVKKIADRLWREDPFDLIHAHFSYPDGVVAARLGRRYRTPVVITEHIPWTAWEKYPGVRKNALRALTESQLHISVSRSARLSVERYAGSRPNLAVIPNGVDGEIFKPPPGGAARIEDQILFAGAVRPIKGVDVLLRAMSILQRRGRRLKLLLAGEAFYGSYQLEEARLRRMAKDLALEDQVRFIGPQAPPELAARMAESALLVLPSRLESFGSVLVEALACGSPVVATRCGGPEDIVNDSVGVLTAVEDPESLAKGIEHVLRHQKDYDPAKLRAYALQKFGLETVGRRLAEVYEDAVRQFPREAASAIPQIAGSH